jgi:hypothetical protein
MRETIRVLSAQNKENRGAITNGSSTQKDASSSVAFGEKRLGIDMHLQVIVSSTTIANVINAFPSDYHKDYSLVRTAAKEYLRNIGSPPSDNAIAALAEHLSLVLTRWGAGKRKAPHPCGGRTISSLLHDARLRLDLSKLALTGLPALTLHMDGRKIMNGAAIRGPKHFDDLLFSILTRLSNELFVGNTNVTYPMKAVLLITGLMPAFDSQVRAGLGRAGFAGVNKTQFLLPSSTENSDAMKLTRLPFVLGHCWTTFRDIFEEGIRGSDHPELVREPGRVFDILFFMQENASVELFRFQGSDLNRWYSIH